jgi:hypothetical protein
VVNDTTCDDLAQSRADTHHSGDGSQREIESASTSRQIGDHEHGHHAENPYPYAFHDWMATSKPLLDVRV